MRNSGEIEYRLGVIGGTRPTRPTRPGPLLHLIQANLIPLSPTQAPPQPVADEEHPVVDKPDVVDEVPTLLVMKSIPDPTRGRVFVADATFRVRYQKAFEPISDDCYAWCQEGDEEWTYTNGVQPMR